MKDSIWIINKSDTPFERTDTDLKRHILIKPMRPIPLPPKIAIKYVNTYSTLAICDHPEKYFEDREFKELIIRDAGIGDLLLLEPLLREMDETTKKQIHVMTRFPEVYTNNPHISQLYKMENKNVTNIDFNLFDMVEDLRSYSETCENRDKINRTDCYNQKLHLRPQDKEPRIYFDKNEKSKLIKKKGLIYVGIQCDASHIYRRYEKGIALVNHILKQSSKYVCVLLGDDQYVKIKKNSRIIDLQGKTDIREAINVIRELDYMIGVDSGLIHVALSMHIPTVAIFTIISPKLRLSYYTGQYVALTQNISCIGCGNYHMVKCKYGDKKKNPKFIPPCLDITPNDIYSCLSSLNIETEKRIIYTGENVVKKEKQKINIITTSKKLTMPIIVLNEERNLPRFIELVIKHPCIGRVVAIDGGSNDKTVKLLESAGAEVYVHPYDKNYHDMQALQRNISCSYVKDNEKIIIMDIDECFSPELSSYLGFLAESDIVYGAISRRTYNLYEDTKYAERQIKDYPDYQPRFFTWNRRFKWVGSPHHEIYNVPASVKINKDIIHFEKEGKDRDALESKWAEMQNKTREIYG